MVQALISTQWSCLLSIAPSGPWRNGPTGVCAGQMGDGLHYIAAVDRRTAIENNNNYVCNYQWDSESATLHRPLLVCCLAIHQGPGVWAP